MKLNVIGSSSRGNCYILKTETCTLLLECGVPFSEIQQRLDYDLSNVVGCMVTHEHQDHCKSVSDVMKSGIDVYMSHGTAEALNACSHRLHLIEKKKQCNIRDFTVLPFETKHDCREPLGFLIQYNPTGETLLFATDTYYIKNRFSGLNYILVECNYCSDILRLNIENGSIPEAMKYRLIKSHFSLKNVKEFLKANDLGRCRKIILLHLSDGNSSVSRMKNEVYELTGIDTEVADTGKEFELKLYPF